MIYVISFLPIFVEVYLCSIAQNVAKYNKVDGGRERERERNRDRETETQMDVNNSTKRKRVRER